MRGRGWRRWRGALWGLLVAAVLAVSRPWTIRPIQTSPPQAFDAAAHVESIWPRVLSEADRTAIDVATAIGTRPAEPIQTHGSRKALFLKGTGVVSIVNLQSRVGVADVRIEGVAPPARISIQVGPVLRGTAVRDALEFVAFTEFANQSDFAAVANGLNDRVLTLVLAPLDLQSLQGRTISFVGACAIGAWRPDLTLDVVPVRLRVAGGAR